VQAGGSAGGAGEAAVDADPVFGNAEREELLGLDDDVLFVGGTAGVPDARGVHGLRCSG